MSHTNRSVIERYSHHLCSAFLTGSDDQVDHGLVPFNFNLGIDTPPVFSVSYSTEYCQIEPNTPALFWLFNTGFLFEFIRKAREPVLNDCDCTMSRNSTNATDYNEICPIDTLFLSADETLD